MRNVVGRVLMAPSTPSRTVKGSAIVAPGVGRHGDGRDNRPRRHLPCAAVKGHPRTSHAGVSEVRRCRGVRYGDT